MQSLKQSYLSNELKQKNIISEKSPNSANVFALQDSDPQGLKEEETDSNKIFGVFATISSLRIKSFTGHTNKSLYLLDNPLYTLVIKLKNGTSLKYFLSNVTP